MSADLSTIILWFPPMCIFMMLFAYYLFKKEMRRGLTQYEITQQQVNKKLHIAILLIVLVVWMIVGYHLFK